MRQSTTPTWRVELSPKAERKLDLWLKKNGYGSYFDMEFTPIPQLSLGVIMEFCQLNKIPYKITEKTKDPIEELEKLVAEFLEEKN